MQQEFKQAIAEAQSKYFNTIEPSKGLEGISIEALHMKGFIDGLTEAMEIEPEFTGEQND